MKNITKTLSERQQMRAASCFYQGMFSTEKYTLPQQVTFKKDLTSGTTFHHELSSFMTAEDMLSSEIIFQGQQYRNGDLVILKMEDCDEAKVGLVQTILINKKGNVYFVCKVYHCVRNWLQYFESVSSETHCSFVEVKNIADYKPLIRRGTSVKFVFVMHHRVSFTYD